MNPPWWLAKPCPSCPAPIGEHCRTRFGARPGTRRGSPHHARMTAAGPNPNASRVKWARWRCSCGAVGVWSRARAPGRWARHHDSTGCGGNWLGTQRRMMTRTEAWAENAPALRARFEARTWRGGKVAPWARPFLRGQPIVLVFRPRPGERLPRASLRAAAGLLVLVDGEPQRAGAYGQLTRARPGKAEVRLAGVPEARA